MAFHITGFPGAQDVEETSATQKHPLGTVAKATDPDKGEIEVIYLKGVASTVVGSLVEINGDHSTTLSSAASKGPLAVAMSINVANQFGWYAVRGRVAAVMGAGGGANAACYLAAGGMLGTATALQGINGAKMLAAASGGFSDVVLLYPSAAGYAAS